MGKGKTVTRKSKPVAKKELSLHLVGQETDVAYGEENISFKGPAVALDQKAAAGKAHTYGGGDVILLGTSKKPESKMTTFEKIDLVDHGIPKKDLEHLKQVAGLDYDKLAKLLSVTRATLINKKGEERFNANLSEKILSLADIYSFGYEVFEDGQRFNEWIFRPNKALGNQTPYDLLGTQFGREEVRNLIGRIDYGVYS